MEFNFPKFQFIAYGKNRNIKENTCYASQSRESIKMVDHAKNLGIIMSSCGTFRQHWVIDRYCKSAMWLDIMHLQKQAKKSNVNLVEIIDKNLCRRKAEGINSKILVLRKSMANIWGLITWCGVLAVSLLRPRYNDKIGVTHHNSYICLVLLIP